MKSFKEPEIEFINFNADIITCSTGCPEYTGGSCGGNINVTCSVLK